jgi:hypothetical protein
MRLLIRFVALATVLVTQLGSVSSQETDEPPATATSDVASPQCRTPWTDGLRRPERFTLVVECITVTGTVIDVRHEADGDLHIPLRLDDDPGILNERNITGQRGSLLVEIEPWQHSATCSALGCGAMVGREASPYCPDFCSPRAGNRLRVTSAIVTDEEHGWNEAHSPTWLEILAVEPVVPGTVQILPA